jgi:hypothetical protein
VLRGRLPAGAAQHVNTFHGGPCVFRCWVNMAVPARLANTRIKAWPPVGKGTSVIHGAVDSYLPSSVLARSPGRFSRGSLST